MVMHKNVPYIRCRDGIYYFVRRVAVKLMKDYPIGDKNFFGDTSIDGIINAENEFS